ncbi:hypothetical protein FA13DRAFT_1712637 [Coprinellus micaceus]|uniref:Uncharacterized protein n=1 Tax=Coprinellus micaceus TaxID=71717 RepID=A0A4Y7SZF2_COPMI|nr:hypothetical protein FA13DRAFT_1712637 [Coprinellus micaceus]
MGSRVTMMVEEEGHTMQGHVSEISEADQDHAGASRSPYLSAGLTLFNTIGANKRERDEGASRGSHVDPAGFGFKGQQGSRVVASRYWPIAKVNSFVGARPRRAYACSWETSHSRAGQRVTKEGVGEGQSRAKARLPRETLSLDPALPVVCKPEAWVNSLLLW